MKSLVRLLSHQHNQHYYFFTKHFSHPFKLKAVTSKAYHHCFLCLTLSAKMASTKHASLAISYVLVLVMLVGFASSDFQQDRTECATQLVGLSTCLPYVGGQAKTPTLDCCSGLKQVLDKSKKCLCVLIKDRDDPNLGLKINATLAATLPSSCHAPINVTDCISKSPYTQTHTRKWTYICMPQKQACVLINTIRNFEPFYFHFVLFGWLKSGLWSSDLLHLPPGSPDAKVFAGYANLTKGINTVPAASGKII